MNKQETPIQDLFHSLKERAKELSCIYQLEEILQDKSVPLENIFWKVIEILPASFYYANQCRVRIAHNGEVYQSPDFKESPWSLRAGIKVENDETGSLEVAYAQMMPTLNEGPFLKEEKQLINTIARRLGQTILHRQLDLLFQAVDVRTISQPPPQPGNAELGLVLEMLRLTDRNLLLKISRRMLNYLCYLGVEEARRLLEATGDRLFDFVQEAQHDGVNRPIKQHSPTMDQKMIEQILSLATRHLGNRQFAAYLQKWINDSKVTFLLNVLDDNTSSLAEITEALARYKDSAISEADLSPSTLNAIKVSLIKRFFTRRLDFINLAKKYIDLADFYDLITHLIYPPKGTGRLGGKSAGLFVAMKVLGKVARHREGLAAIRVPKTWYVASDGIIDFLHYNHLEDLLDFKYHRIDEIRIEYPNMVQLFKNSSFSPTMINALSMMLDDFGDVPLIVRSSSLLEDGAGHAFSGKYKSLFLANQGTKHERLDELLTAIAEIYASTFGPDPIEYRAERGLLDFSEEMGLLIQEVVGDRIGHYLLPAYAGVAFSRNDFRWSARIKREDGLVRIVPGLGTRAVERLSDDFPVLISPGQPGLRVNPSLDEKIRYAPKYIDAINLGTNSIETVKVEELVQRHGGEYPLFKRIFSLVRDDLLQDVGGLPDFREDFFIVTFEGLVTKTPFIKQMKELLEVLEDAFGSAVDVEFAADRNSFFLLQCRTQSAGKDRRLAALPHDVPVERILFTANKYITDAYLPEISHLVYVSPEAYDRLSSLDDLKDVGKAIGRLNNILPERQFILMGPGRWGSRGDIKLGVSVTYSDINNTAALIEMAFRKGNYLPDLSFGTHFFQDLVEAGIAYLPLYPEEPGNVFRHDFFLEQENKLPVLLPDYRTLSEVIRVIDVPAASGGRILRLVMNGDEEKAIAYLTTRHDQSNLVLREGPSESRKDEQQQFWIWRLRMAESIAARLDPERFGVQGFYVFGSTKNATAGPCSDIDLLIHLRGTEQQKKDLDLWLQAWSVSLAEVNYQRTGYETDGLLDVHYITDEDIRNKTSYAVKIDAVNDAVRPLTMNTHPPRMGKICPTNKK